MDFSLTAEQEMLRDETRAFCEKELNREYVRWMDENCDFVPDELWQKMAALGHFEMMIPTEYGGLGLGSLEAMLVLEEVASASVAVALGVGAAVGFGATTIRNLGQRRTEARASPQACQGRDQVRAGPHRALRGHRHPRCHPHPRRESRRALGVLNGQKVFITAAHVADYLITVAITDPDAKRSDGLSICPPCRDRPKGSETRLIPEARLPRVRRQRGLLRGRRRPGGEPARNAEQRLVRAAHDCSTRSGSRRR